MPAMPLLRPRRLTPGQTVGLVAPSAAPNDPEHIRFAIETLESLGCRVRPGAHLCDRDGYLAGADAARAADLNAMFADDGVDAVWCVRGGYGASRILPMLDYDLMRRKPKALIGFSDITALHMAIHTQVGLVSFHGPVAGGRSRVYAGERGAGSASERAVPGEPLRPSRRARVRSIGRTG